MFERNIEEVRKLRKYSMGRKIPNHVKQFSRTDIKEGEFRINNSSVLRTMTKWA